MKVLITGGAGYIGSTVASACEDAGHDVVILDDFSTGRREFVGTRPVYEGDIADDSLLDRLFGEQRIDAVVHCAAKIIVPESVSEPLAYYENNVAKTIALLAALQRNGVEGSCSAPPHPSTPPTRTSSSPRTHRCSPAPPTRAPSSWWN